MPSSVIEAVEELADRDKQEGTLEFTDRDGNTYDDLYDTNQPTDGAAGVDIVEEPTQDEQEHEEETINEDVEFPTAELDTEITGVAPLENPRIENPEIPGVELNSEIPGVGTAETPGVGTEETPGVHNEEIEEFEPGNEETEPEHTDMNLEAPEMEEAPEEPITVPPPIQSGEDGEHEYENSGPPPPLSPRSEHSDSDSDDEDEDDEPDEEIPDDEVYHPDTMTPPVQST
jgi:hypothetical protein